LSSALYFMTSAAAGVSVNAKAMLTAETNDKLECDMNSSLTGKFR
jgi:hypothetical protein